MSTRTWICSSLLAIVTTLLLAYIVFRIDDDIIIFDADADGRHEVKLRIYRNPGGPLRLRWWYMVARPAVGWIAHLEVAYRDLRGVPTP